MSEINHLFNPDFNYLQVKSKSFIFNRLPYGQKVQLNFLGSIQYLPGAEVKCTKLFRSL